MVEDDDITRITNSILGELASDLVESNSDIIDIINSAVTHPHCYKLISRMVCEEYIKGLGRDLPKPGHTDSLRDSDPCHSVVSPSYGHLEFDFGSEQTEGIRRSKS